jgi:hypothetical protein
MTILPAGLQQRKDTLGRSEEIFTSAGRFAILPVELLVSPMLTLVNLALAVALDP